MPKHRHEVLEELLQYFEPEKLLRELVEGLGDSIALDHFEYICRMYDIPGVFDDDDEEGDEDD